MKCSTQACTMCAAYVCRVGNVEYVICRRCRDKAAAMFGEAFEARKLRDA